MAEPPNPAVGSVASWLGVLVLLLVTLIGLGGYVRLSGSGLSIPEWPVPDEGLLPPLSSEEIERAYRDFAEDQLRLREAAAEGQIGLGSLGRSTRDPRVFHTMYLVEWSHRAVAGIILLIALGCTMVVLRSPELRPRIGGKVASMTGLTVFQAVLGGLLVWSGTSTHFLFLHLGMAAIILGLAVWSLLDLLRIPGEVPSTADRTRRKPVDSVLVVAIVVTFVQLVLGALVAGSRSGAGVVMDWPGMGGEWIPGLWQTGRSLAWNLLDNAILHQWIHRWFAWVVVAMVVVAFFLVRARPAGQRQRLGIHLALGLTVSQVLLGIANVFEAAQNLPIALAHLVVGMVLLANLVQVLFDCRHEPSAVAGPDPVPAPA